MSKKSIAGWILALIAIAVITLSAAPSFAHGWKETDFAARPLYAYPLPHGHDDIIGSDTTYTIQSGDTLLDVARWFGLSAKEISEANGGIDWWTPPAGKTIILPSEHILPDAPHVGLVLNVPEMRLYYYYPSPTERRRHGKLFPVSNAHAAVVYTFPVGLGRFDWKTPLGKFYVTAKVKNPTWVVPQDIYEEHLERDGEAEHVVYGDDPDNPLGHYKLDLSIPEYGIHGTNVPWGVGMEVSHGCIRLYPEDIDRLFHKVKAGTPGLIVYQPIKFGWRGNSLYVEVHKDLYGKYPGLWNLAVHEINRRGLRDDIDMHKLQVAVEKKTGVPTYVMPGPPPPGAAGPGEEASSR
ncbi:MAG: L,D-transpeptidase family protein [Candidatus Binataceae bacterium]